MCYLPNSPVSLLSVSCLAEKLHDSVNTRINSGMLESVLTWDNGKFSRSIPHSNRRLEELPINEKNSLFSSVTNKISGSTSAITKCKCCSGDRIYGHTAFFTKGDVVSTRIDGNLAMAKVIDVSTDKMTLRNTYKLKVNDDIFIMAGDSDVFQNVNCSIDKNALSKESIDQALVNLGKKIDDIQHPSKLSSNQQELLQWHIRLGHPP